MWLWNFRARDQVLSEVSVFVHGVQFKSELQTAAAICAVSILLCNICVAKKYTVSNLNLFIAATVMEHEINSY